MCSAFVTVISSGMKTNAMSCPVGGMLNVTALTPNLNKSHMNTADGKWPMLWVG